MVVVLDFLSSAQMDGGYDSAMNLFVPYTEQELCTSSRYILYQYIDFGVHTHFVLQLKGASKLLSRESTHNLIVVVMKCKTRA